MKKINSKFLATKSSAALSTFLSLAFILFWGRDCVFFFHEPERPEGFDTISLKDVLPTKKER